MLDPRIDFGIDGSEHRTFQLWTASDAAMRPHQDDVVAAQSGRESNTLLRISDEHVRCPELFVNVEYRHAGCDERRIVEHRPHWNSDKAEWNHGL